MLRHFLITRGTHTNHFCYSYFYSNSASYTYNFKYLSCHLRNYISTYSGGFYFVLKGVRVEHVPLLAFFYVSTRSYY